jgi:hypothetical protein
LDEVFPDPAVLRRSIVLKEDLRSFKIDDAVAVRHCTG